MGWKGTLRSMAAASRAASRDAERRYKQREKTQMIADSAEAVSDWEDYISSLVSVHTNQAASIDWPSMAKRSRPPEPAFDKAQERIATAKLHAFKPGIFDFFRGGSEKIKSGLEAAIVSARLNDAATYQNATTAHAQAVNEWEEDRDLAQRLLAGQPEAIRKVLETETSLKDEVLIGTAIEFSVQPSLVHASPRVHGDDIVPSVRRKQLASGRLSESKMPVGQFNELYQDYVCSVALKTAGDLFNLLPYPEVYVTCTAHMLNRQSGHQEWTPILSVQFVRDTFARLNMNKIDPSDAMRNFRHAMKFSKTQGFSEISPLTINQ